MSRLIELFKSSLDVVDIDVLIREAVFDDPVLDTNPDANDDDDDVFVPLKASCGSSPNRKDKSVVISIEKNDCDKIVIL